MKESTVDALTKAAAFAGIALYIVGLLVSNLYLRNFGFADFSLLRTRYVFTGASALIYLLVIGGAVSTLFDLLTFATVSLIRKSGLIPKLPPSLRQHVDFHVVDGFVRRNVSLLAFLISVAWVLATLVADSWSMLDWSALALLLPAAVAVPLFDLLPRLVAGLTTSQVPKQKESTALVVHSVEPSDTEPRKVVTAGPPVWSDSNLLSIINRPVGLAATVVLYLAFYANYFYPNLPEQWGGGKARNVQFVMNGAYLTDASALGLISDTETLLTPSYPLIWEGETNYLIGPFDLSGEQLVVQVDKRIVSGVVSPLDSVPLTRFPSILRPRKNGESESEPATPIATPGPESIPEPKTPIESRLVSRGNLN